MTMTYAEIKEGVRGLRRSEQYDLLQDLKQELEPPSAEETVEAAWDAEIDDRAKAVMAGEVELISGEQMEKELDTLFLKLGIKRKAVA